MYQEIKEKFNQLEKDLADPNISSDQEKLKKASQQRAELKELIGLISQWEKITSEIAQNQEMVKTETDKDLKKLAETELNHLITKEEQLRQEIENELHPADPRDKKNIIMEIRAGAGGDESALFTAELFRAYSRYAEKKGWKINLLDSSRIGIGGFKEATLEITGKGVYGDLKYEGGIHRVQRVPETEKTGRIHTSAVTVAVMPEAEEMDVELKPQDIRIDAFCSSGPGGQSVNTTYSAIRIIHLPTNTVVTCQDQKSQHQNKEKAMRILRSRLLARAEEEKRQKEATERKQQIGSGDRSEKIRTYNFPQDRVTDHRINQNWHGIARIMEGGFGDIIEALKKSKI